MSEPHILTLTFPDGVLELAPGDCYSGPGGCFGALHLNTTTTWVRRPGEVWRHCYTRSLHKARLEAEALGSAVDAWRWLTEEWDATQCVSPTNSEPTGPGMSGT